MWDDVIIGENNKNNCSAVKLNNYSFSHNRISYWFNNLICDLRMTIYKDTEEGKYISKMLEENASEEEILKYVNVILIKNIDPQVLINKINIQIQKERVDATDKAKYKLQKKLRELLGFNDFY